MRWIKIGGLIALALSLNCGDEFAVGDGQLQDIGVKDALATDSEPGGFELVTGGVWTLGNEAITETKLEGKPDYEVADDGLEYLGVFGDQCTADQSLCLTEGGILP